MQRSEEAVLRTLEDELRNKLYEVVQSIASLVGGFPEGSPSQGSAFGSPLLMYDDEVNAILRHSAQAGYELGTEHATAALKQEGYLTHADVDTIKQIASQHGARFWGRVQRGVIEKEMQIRNLQFTGEAPDTHLTREWIVDAIASSDVFTAYNEAIRTKAARLV